MPIVLRNYGGSSAPNTPSSPSPADGATGQGVTVDLGWTGGDPDGDAVTYDVYFEAGDSSPDVLVSNHQSPTGYDPGTLAAGTHYYWQIVATDQHAASTTGPVWDFTTTGGAPPPGDMITIPAGSFWMGCDPDHVGGYWCFADENPLHPVTLDAYTIDKYEVTNAQYADFLNAVGNQKEGDGTWLNTDGLPVRIHQNGAWQADTGYADHPVVSVTWYGARAYCQWAAKRLPTEAEWEKAARGADDTRAYPWGDDPTSCARANSYSDEEYKACAEDTTPVGSYPAGASPYGALDMAGNVWEWVNDWHSSSYYSSSPASNPPGPASGTYKVMRGGAFGTAGLAVRASYRGEEDPSLIIYFGGGFRCAASAPGP